MVLLKYLHIKFFSLTLVWLILPHIITASTQSDCFKILTSAGATPDYGGNVAHGIHSLTVQKLREFQPFISINNSIPTINMDLRADSAILDFAPESPNSPFITNGMKTLDLILRNMDNKYYDVKYFTILERIVHAFHMQEVWEMAKLEYDAFKNFPPSHSVCQCAIDTENNGIMKALRFTALAIREPELIYGKSKEQYYVQYEVTYHFGASNKLDANAPFDAPNILLKETDAMPELVDEKSWSKWKEILTSMDPRAHKDLALFLFCSLN